MSASISERFGQCIHKWNNRNCDIYANVKWCDCSISQSDSIYRRATSKVPTAGFITIYESVCDRCQKTVIYVTSDRSCQSQDSNEIFSVANMMRFVEVICPKRWFLSNYNCYQWRKKKMKSVTINFYILVDSCHSIIIRTSATLNYSFMSLWYRSSDTFIIERNVAALKRKLMIFKKQYDILYRLKFADDRWQFFNLLSEIRDDIGTWHLWK